MTIGSDQREVAPYLLPGQVSAPTPTPGLSTQEGEYPSGVGQTAWWRIIVTQTMAVRLDATTSSVEAVVTLYPADGDDSQYSVAGPRPGMLEVVLEPGQYAVQLDHTSATAGDYVLAVTIVGTVEAADVTVPGYIRGAPGASHPDTAPTVVEGSYTELTRTEGSLYWKFVPTESAIVFLDVAASHAGYGFRLPFPAALIVSTDATFANANDEVRPIADYALPAPEEGGAEQLAYEFVAGTVYWIRAAASRATYMVLRVSEPGRVSAWVQSDDAYVITTQDNQPGQWTDPTVREDGSMYEGPLGANYGFHGKQTLFRTGQNTEPRGQGYPNFEQSIPAMDFEWDQARKHYFPTSTQWDPANPPTSGGTPGNSTESELSERAGYASEEAVGVNSYTSTTYVWACSKMIALTEMFEKLPALGALPASYEDDLAAELNYDPARSFVRFDGVATVAGLALMPERSAPPPLDADEPPCQWFVELLPQVVADGWGPRSFGFSGGNDPEGLETRAFLAFSNTLAEWHPIDIPGVPLETVRDREILYGLQRGLIAATCVSPEIFKRITPMADFEEKVADYQTLAVRMQIRHPKAQLVEAPVSPLSVVTNITDLGVQAITSGLRETRVRFT